MHPNKSGEISALPKAERASHRLPEMSYAVVLLKSNYRRSTLALRLTLPQTREVGPEHVGRDRIGDVALQVVIEGKGGRCAGEFVTPFFGAAQRLLYTIDLARI